MIYCKLKRKIVFTIHVVYFIFQFVFNYVIKPSLRFIFDKISVHVYAFRF